MFLSLTNFLKILFYFLFFSASTAVVLGMIVETTGLQRDKQKAFVIFLLGADIGLLALLVAIFIVPV